jgi:response regulator aspartate phosphatase G/response regulator aspartate phosphatase K
MNKIAAEEVANMLNTWYRAIRRSDAEQSIRLFEQIKPLLADMEEDQEVLIYFSLLELRHKIMLYDARGKKIEQHDVTAATSAASHMTSYYYYLFSGAYEVYKKNYEHGDTASIKLPRRSLLMYMMKLKLPNFTIKSESSTITWARISSL